jgi:hypothetical protein
MKCLDVKIGCGSIADGLSVSHQDIAILFQSPDNPRDVRVGKMLQHLADQAEFGVRIFVVSEQVEHCKRPIRCRKIPGVLLDYQRNDITPQVIRPAEIKSTPDLEIATAKVHNGFDVVFGNELADKFSIRQYVLRERSRAGIEGLPRVSPDSLLVDIRKYLLAGCA